MKLNMAVLRTADWLGLVRSYFLFSSFFLIINYRISHNLIKIHNIGDIRKRLLCTEIHSTWTREETATEDGNRSCGIHHHPHRWHQGHTCRTRTCLCHDLSYTRDHLTIYTSSVNYRTVPSLPCHHTGGWRLLQHWDRVPCQLQRRLTGASVGWRRAETKFRDLSSVTLQHKARKEVAMRRSPWCIGEK